MSGATGANFHNSLYYPDKYERLQWGEVPRIRAALASPSVNCKKALRLSGAGGTERQPELSGLRRDVGSKLGNFADLSEISLFNFDHSICFACRACRN